MKPLSLKIIARLCAASSAAVIACTGLAAMAQNAPPPGGHGGHSGPPPAAHRGGGDHGGERIQRLHDLLQITPGQEQSFKTWLAAMKPQGRPERPGGPRGAGPGHERRPGQDFRAMTTPQRIDARLAMMDKRDAEMRARATATKAFYNGLSPAQQKAMDSLPPMMGRGHGHRGHGGKHAGPGGWRGHDQGGGFGAHRGPGEQGGLGGPPPQ